MDRETLRKVQLTQLEIAKEVKRICDDNNIEYWLDSGSLLGAVRHKGFIPWDDDMDLGMKRDSYENFLKIAPLALKPQFHLQQWNSDSEYGLCFAKVRKVGTIFRENKSWKSAAENGIYIDIFPYDIFGNDYKGQGIPLKVLKATIQVKSGIQTWKENNSIDGIRLLKNVPIMLLSKLFFRKNLIEKYTEYATKYNGRKLEYYFPQGISNYGKWTIPVSAMEEMVEMPFEDTLFKIPKGYDEYLTHAYGEYMKLPPENERENRHQILEVKI